MGNRANIYLELPASYAPDTPMGGVYLYTHWNGDEWPERLREALAFGRGRWFDDEYIARIITSRVFADLVDDKTGGGLALRLGDNEHPIVVVEVIEETVSFADPGDETDPAKRYGRMTFAEYVTQGRASYPVGVTP